MPSSRGSSNPGIEPGSPALQADSFFSFFKYKFIYFNWRLITLEYCIGFAIHQHESATGVHVLPILNPPPSPYHPSGSSQCTSPKHPISCIEPGLAIHFLYDVIHVYCHSSKSSHPLPLPQSPKHCSIHLYLFCCLTYKVIVTIFLNSICMPQYTVLVFFFLAYFTLYNRLQFHPPHQN